jgi:hypothetical protein
MTDQWEKYVEAAGDAMLDCDHNGIQCYTPKPIDETARAVLAAVGPLIAEDTRVRMVEAAARAVERAPGWTAVEVTIEDEVDRKYAFNGDEADEVWVDRP